MAFELHQNFAKKIAICTLPLCQVLLEDNACYPWLLLVPQRPVVTKIMDLTSSDQLQLLKEMDSAQNILWKLFKPTQLNVAAIGNKTPQLHIHVIARRDTDPAWPKTVWDHPEKRPYDEAEKQELILQLRDAFSQ